MELDDTVAGLASNPLFSCLEPSKLKLIAFASDQLVFRDGETVFSQGDAADGAYLVEKGEATVYVTDGEKQVLVNELYKSDIFGEMALILKSGRTATVKARGELTVLKVEGDFFLKLVSENPKTALGVMTVLSERIANLSDKVAQNG